jgi:hypothetical protein
LPQRPTKSPHDVIRAQTCLFSAVPVHERFEKMLRFATNAVRSMESDDILACDIEATVVDLMQEYRFEFPAIAEAGITKEVKEPEPLKRHAPYIIRFFIPYTGDGELLRTQPTTPPPGPAPLGTLRDRRIEVTFKTAVPDAAQIKSLFEGVLGTIRRYLETLKPDTEHEFAKLEARIREMLTERREQLERAGRLAKDLGYPLHRREDPSGMAVPLVRKQIPVIAPARAPRPIVAEPYIEEAIYKEILNLLASMSLLIERNPTTFAHIDEQTLRDHFLLQLNGQFEGKATGETFNGAGKTDILLREQDKNLFIAECKFWDGPKSLKDAIDQLFTYATWRDSKAAVLVFSRRRGFTRTIGEAGKALTEHPQFREQRTTSRETSFRAWMARPDDEQRRIDLTVMLFNVAAGAGGAVEPGRYGLRGPLKAARYAMEGVKGNPNALRGTETMPYGQLSPGEIAEQGLGFTPQRVADIYERNTAKQNVTSAIEARRSKIVSDYAAAVSGNDDKASAKAGKELEDFNTANPGVAITLRDIRAKLTGVARAEGGYVGPKGLHSQLDAEYGGSDEETQR